MLGKQSLTVSLFLLSLAGGVPGVRGAEEDGRWKDLVKRLADPDFAVRDAAQKDLSKVDWHSLAILKQLAAEETDLEASARLKARVTEIEEDAYTDPHPISLDIDNLPLTSVGMALSKAMDVKIETLNNRNGDGYTIHAREKPFWEVFRELSAQHPISFINYSTDSIRLNPSGNDLSRMSVFGPLALVPMSITRTRRSNLTAPPGNELEPEQLQFQYMIMVDPRVKMISYRQPVILEATDSNGAVLIKEAGEGRLTTLMANRTTMINLNSSALLQVPPKPAKSIAVLKGSFSFVASLGDVVATMDEADKKAGQSVQLGDVSVKINRLEVKNGTINASFERQPPNNGAVNGPSTPIAAEILDSTGRKLWSLTLTTSMSGGYSGGTVATPLKVKFSMPVKTKEVTIPFELKDLPLP